MIKIAVPVGPITHLQICLNMTFYVSCAQYREDHLGCTRSGTPGTGFTGSVHKLYYSLSDSSLAITFATFL